MFFYEFLNYLRNLKEGTYQIQNKDGGTKKLSFDN